MPSKTTRRRGGRDEKPSRLSPHSRKILSALFRPGDAACLFAPFTRWPASILISGLHGSDGEPGDPYEAGRSANRSARPPGKIPSSPADRRSKRAAAGKERGGEKRDTKSKGSNRANYRYFHRHLFGLFCRAREYRSLEIGRDDGKDAEAA
jgi:hypothetical protein